MCLTFFYPFGTKDKFANLVSDYASVSQPARVQVKGLGYWLFLVETRQDETGEEFPFSRDQDKTSQQRLLGNFLKNGKI